MDGYLQFVRFMDIVTVLVIVTVCIGTTECRRRRYQSSVPEFMEVPTNITVHEGEIAKLRCSIRNLGPKMVVWRKTPGESPITIGTSVFSPDSRFSIEHHVISVDKTLWNLEIMDVAKEHAGTYECQVSATDIYTHNVTLNVLDPKKYKPHVTVNGTRYVSLLEEIHLTCNATGADKAPDAVDWFFNGDVVHESRPAWYGRTAIVQHKPYPGRTLISELIIEKATMLDRGNYLCRSIEVGKSSEVDAFKVHVLNDRKNHIAPKRELVFDNSGESSDALNQNKGSYGTSLHGDELRSRVTWLTFVLTVLLFHR